MYTAEKELPLNGNLHHIKNWINNYPCINFREMLKLIFMFIDYRYKYPDFPFLNILILCVHKTLNCN